jgi:opacity protein-like surface antigen
MKKTLFYCFLFACFSQTVIASNPITIPIYLPHGWYLGANTGATFPQVDNDNFLATSAGWPNDQYRYSGANSAALLSLFGGYTWNTGRNWFPFYSLAASYSYVFPAKINGVIRQYSLPIFENYNFNYKVQRQTFLAIFKTDIYRWQNIMPFLTAGVGFSILKASNYTENPVPGVTARLSPGLGSHTNINVSYTFGAGLDFILQKNIVLSAEYQYGYFGHTATGAGIAGYTNQKLSTTLSANTLILSANYFLDKSA